MKRFPRWLGSLLTPAEDPRPPTRSAAAPVEAEALLAELRRSRDELAQLRSQVAKRAPESRVTVELEAEEQALLEAEASVLLAVDERRAEAALRRARRRLIDVELLADV